MYCDPERIPTRQTTLRYLLPEVLFERHQETTQAQWYCGRPAVYKFQETPLWGLQGHNFTVACYSLEARNPIVGSPRTQFHGGLL